MRGFVQRPACGNLTQVLPPATAQRDALGAAVRRLNFHLRDGSLSDVVRDDRGGTELLKLLDGGGHVVTLRQACARAVLAPFVHPEALVCRPVSRRRLHIGPVLDQRRAPAGDLVEGRRIELGVRAVERVSRSAAGGRVLRPETVQSQVVRHVGAGGRAAAAWVLLAVAELRLP